MTSAILRCGVGHARLAPVKHAFSYGINRFLVDVDELPRLDKESTHFGYNRFALLSIYDRDYLDRGPGTIREKTERLLRKHGVGRPADKIFLVTDPSLFRLVFNPVSIYYVFAADGSPTAVLLEVNNTMGDRHLYVVPGGTETGKREFPLSHRAEKDFHVSPFNNREGTYEMLFSDPRDRVEIRIDLHRDEGLVFKASLIEKERIPLSGNNIMRASFSPFLAPWRTMPRILLQAARLFFGKKLKFHGRPVVSSSGSLRIRNEHRGQRFFRKEVEKFLGRIRVGRLRLETPAGFRFFGPGDAPLRADIRVREWKFFTRAALGGDVGFGDAYVDGLWDSPDPAALVRLIIDNRPYLEEKRLAPRFLNAVIGKTAHFLRENTLRGSRRNIRFHYDLSNKFFQSFLDPGMTYSSGIYGAPSESLERAQKNKLESIAEKALLGPEDHVLEIGCGWGSFAIHAARTRGCRVTGITLSEEQFALARERVKAEGLSDRIEILLVDYRTVQGKFDKIVSIEMLEAVGHRRLNTFFRRCDELLTENGLAVIQVITIPDQKYDDYRKGIDWIRKNIFPGGHLPSLTAMCSAATRASSLIVESVENIGVHYARTLSDWRSRFVDDPSNKAALEKRSPFHRMWLFYLCYCQAAFEARALEDLQIVFTRPGNRLLPPAPYQNDAS